jgi:hypothetical protein
MLHTHLPRYFNHRQMHEIVTNHHIQCQPLQWLLSWPTTLDVATKSIACGNNITLGVAAKSRWVSKLVVVPRLYILVSNNCVLGITKRICVGVQVVLELSPAPSKRPCIDPHYGLWQIARYQSAATGKRRFFDCSKAWDCRHFTAQHVDGGWCTFSNVCGGILFQRRFHDHLRPRQQSNARTKKKKQGHILPNVQEGMGLFMCDFTTRRSKSQGHKAPIPSTRIRFHSQSDLF